MKAKPEVLTAVVLTVTAAAVVSIPVVLTGVVIGYLFTVWRKRKHL